MPTATVPRRRRRRPEWNVDNFAGGGGASLGITQGGVPVHVAINHNPAAVAMHKRNHPACIHYCGDAFAMKPREVLRGNPMGLGWFSPACTHFSGARGAKPVREQERALAWVVITWAREARPRVIMLENVREFEGWGPIGPDGQPIKEKAGITFKQWVGRLKGLGYAVEWKTLNAADYGAPTHRRRLFLIARRDGRPIVWPAPTHGPGCAKPWRTAAECIDFSLPTYSIFMTKEEAKAYGVKRPLAENTMRRIANGVRRYVIDAAEPFIVRTGHYSNVTGEGAGFRGQGLGQPMGAVCGTNDKALVVPHVSQFYGGVVGKPVNEPLPCITGTDHNALVSAFLARMGQTGGNGKYVNDAREPLTAVTAKAEHMLTSVHLTKNAWGEKAAQGVDEPLHTVTTQSNKFQLTAATLVGVGGRAGQSPPCSVDEPLRTITAKGDRALAAAHLVKLRGSGGWKRLDEPMDTVVAGATTFGLVSSHLTNFRGTNKDGEPLTEPLPCLTAGGMHFGEVRAFLVKYYGTANGQSLLEPMHTIPTTDRFAVVTVEGVDYAIADIGLRMLTPRELARAQGFPDTYELVGTQEQQVARIGNSVSPPVAEAVTRANMSDTDVILTDLTDGLAA